MFDDCPKFQQFRKELESRGVLTRFAWVLSTEGPTQPANVGFVLFTGSGFQPRILAAVIINYGKDGFGLYEDGGRETIAEDVDFIAGGNPQVMTWDDLYHDDPEHQPTHRHHFQPT